MDYRFPISTDWQGSTGERAPSSVPFTPTTPAMCEGCKRTICSCKVCHETFCKCPFPNGYVFTAAGPFVYPEE